MLEESKIDRFDSTLQILKNSKIIHLLIIRKRLIENARKIENRLALQILKILIIEERSIENARRIENRVALQS